MSEASPIRSPVVRAARWLYAPLPEAHTYHLARFLFLRLLGLVYFVAFLSLATRGCR